MQRAAPLEATFQRCDNRPCFELSSRGAELCILQQNLFSKLHKGETK